MCRIKNNPDKYELIKQERARISKGGSVSVIVEDPKMGDTTFKISILNKGLNDSVTRIDFRDPHIVIVEIVNPTPSLSVYPDVPMKVGTYNHNKALYMDYKLYKQYDNEDYREINIEFGTRKGQETD